MDGIAARLLGASLLAAVAGCASAHSDADAGPGDPPDGSLPQPDARTFPDAMPGTPDAMVPPDAPGTPDAGCVDQVVQQLTNPAFDSGPGVGWVETGGFDIVLSQSSSPDPFPFAPDTPAYAAWLGGADNSTQALYQDVAIPAGATAPTLSWQSVIGTQETVAIAFDTFTITVRDLSNNVLETVITQSNLDAGTDATWIPMVRNLSGNYAGQTVRLYFEAVTDISNPSNFFVDSVALDVTVCQ